MKHVKFISNYAPYAKEEIASFEDAIADSFVKAKIAVEHAFKENANKDKGNKDSNKVGE